MAEKHRGMETNCELRQRCGRSREGKKESCTSKKKLTIHDPGDRCERISEDMSWYLGRHRRRSRGDWELGATGGWVSLQVAKWRRQKEKCWNGERRTNGDSSSACDCFFMAGWNHLGLGRCPPSPRSKFVIYGRHFFTTLCT